MQDEVLTITKNGYTLSVWRDDYPVIDPRKDYDNLGTLYIPRPPRGCSFSDEGANAKDAHDAPVKIPVYILDHSGMAVSPIPFGDVWDSWKAGVYYVTAEKIREEYGNAPDAAKKALQVARAELQTFADYIAGDIYGFTITDASGCERESVSGYFGKDGIQAIEADFPGYITEFETEDYPLFAGIEK